MIRVGILAAVIIIIVASIFFGFREAAREHAPKPAAGSAKPHPAVGTPLEHARTIRKIDPESRRLLRAHIDEARAKRTAASAGRAMGTAASAEPAMGTATSAEPEAPVEDMRDYLGTQIEAIAPLLAACNPGLAGELLVSFTVDGEPDVGGVVGNSEIDPAHSTITDAGTIECVRETMYALELAAPPDGGSYKVKNKFVFTRDGSAAR